MADLRLGSETTLCGVCVKWHSYFDFEFTSEWLMAGARKPPLIESF